jgi:hypothetical protein
MLDLKFSSGLGLGLGRAGLGLGLGLVVCGLDYNTGASTGCTQKNTDGAKFEALFPHAKDTKMQSDNFILQKSKPCFNHSATDSL